MTLLYYDPIFLEHDTGGHPECADRIREIGKFLAGDGLTDKCTHPEFSQVSSQRLSKVHPPEYAKMIEEFAAAGGGRIESDTIVSTRSYAVALRAAGAAVDAVQRVLREEDRRALCLVRPPGHHALSQKVMGFCLFNNVAVAARVANDEFDVDRVMIVDWDVHHGNGTQAIFWKDEQIAFFSIHRWPFYPGTGTADETGSGAGLGTTMNLPTEFGVSRDKYYKSFSTHLQRFAERLKPQLVLVSAGFDSHREDPIGSLGLETEDFARLTRTVLDIADSYSQGRLVSILEGGYNTKVLAECVGLHLRELLA